MFLNTAQICEATSAMSAAGTRLWCITPHAEHFLPPTGTQQVHNRYTTGTRRYTTGTHQYTKVHDGYTTGVRCTQCMQLVWAYPSTPLLLLLKTFSLAMQALLPHVYICLFWHWSLTLPAEYLDNFSQVGLYTEADDFACFSHPIGYNTSSLNNVQWTCTFKMITIFSLCGSKKM